MADELFLFLKDTEKIQRITLLESEIYMKKLIYLFLLILPIIFVHAEETSTTISHYYLGNYHYVDQNNKFGDFEVFNTKDNQRIAYCIEPGLPFAEASYQGYYHLTNDYMTKASHLSLEQLKLIRLYAYYGFRMSGVTNNSSYYVAAQTLIWELLGRQVSFTSKNYSPNPRTYIIETPDYITWEMNQIKTKAADYQEINKEYDIEIPAGGQYVLKDDQITKSMIITSETNSTNILDDGSITIKPNDDGELELQTYTNEFGYPYTVYIHPDGQDFIQAGDIPKLTIKIHYKVIRGSISVNVLDNQTKTCQNDINSILYGLYDDEGRLVDTFHLKDCKATIPSLDLKKYSIKQIKSSDNYHEDKQSYDIAITSDKKDENQILYVNKYESKIKVIQVNQETKETIIHPSFAFKLFANDEKKYVCESEDCIYHTDSQGTFTTKDLPLGSYTLEEINTNDNQYEWNSQKIDIQIDKNTGDVYTVAFPNQLKEIVYDVPNTYQDDGSHESWWMDDKKKYYFIITIHCY